jgi:DUF4097 and DUF4098 domain-containing protein YvlB
LSVQTLQGSIEVEAYSGKEVVVRYSNITGRPNRQAPDEVDGMKRVSNNSMGLEIQEDNNDVTVKVTSFMRAADLSILVPKNFSLSLKTVNDGTIKVTGVRGELDISNLNGSIYLKDIAGSAAVNTLNGNVEADFAQLTGNEVLSFTNLNGKIKLNLPPQAKFSVKAKSQFGEIYTDFDMKMKRETTRSQSTSADGMYQVKIDEWVQGTVNGGGPEIYIKSLNGNVYIRKK